MSSKLREKLAHALWLREAERVGPPSTISGRTPEAFRESSADNQERWLHFADAVLSVLSALVADEVVGEIRARHEAAEKDGGHEWCGVHGPGAHNDRATLLRLIEQRDAEIERLRDALKPFAEFCDALVGNNLNVPRERQSDDSPVYGFNFTVLTMGNFRQARAALRALTQEQKP